MTSRKYSFLKAFCIGLLLMPLGIWAQKTEVYNQPQRIYNRAIELFEHAQYGEAQKHFLLYMERSDARELSVNAMYYAGVCAMELFNPDAVNYLLGVYSKFPEHAKAKPAIFQLGKYYYRNKDNKNAVKYLQYVTPQDLTPSDAEELSFIKGYCYFKLDQFDDSKLSFANIVEKPGKYFDGANYYYGYIIYREGKYEEALEKFLRIKNNKTFSPLASVYVAQIYFVMKRYSEVVSFADTISNKNVKSDIAGIVGQSHFQLGNYSNAVPHLELFNAKSPLGKTTQDIYRLGYSYLRMGNYEKAIEQLSSIATNKDTTAQFASYHLAEAYLATNQKRPARLAFDRAYHNGYNEKITELSLYNHAKLSFELSFQQEALKDLVLFVNLYPNSELIDDAKGLLTDLLMATKNYKEAITIIEGIKNPTQDNKLAYQRVCYYRAEELYLNNDYIGALETFKKSQVYEFDKRLFALSYFWLGEIAYRQSAFNEAFNHYNKFSSYKEIKDTRFYALSFYNKGYAKLKLEDYITCIAEMKQFLETEYAINNIELYTDASIRIADCHLAVREYNQAIKQYQFIVDKNLVGSDYALYQMATIHGVLNKPEDKLAALYQLTAKYKKSTYIDDAIYDIAMVKLQTEEYDQAIAGFQNIIDNYPRSQYLRKAILNKGLGYYNLDRDDQALLVLKELIQQYPTSGEARDAMLVVKNIFLARSDAEGYLEFAKVLPHIELSPSYQDSITYESAFNAYKNNDCVKASKGFNSYIQKFPGGFFILKAHFYKAECDFIQKNMDTALVSYEYVATQMRSDFTEKAVKQTAILYYMQKNYEKAFTYYGSLERIASNKDNLSAAMLGQIKSASFLGKLDECAAVSARYINSTVSSKDGLIEARFNLGKFYLRENKTDSAIIEFQYVIKETKSVWAAESKYYLAKIMFDKNQLKDAKTHIFELSDNYSNYEYWVAKGYLILADMYTNDKDYFQAKATLQSLLDNFEGKEITDAASEKLKRIIEMEESIEKERKSKLNQSNSQTN